MSNRFFEACARRRRGWWHHRLLRCYHLADLGWKDVVLLERDRVTSGTTWHAAGLIVTFGSMSETSTEMRKYTRSLFARLEAETGLSTGFKPVGFIEVASEKDRLEEYRRVSAFNRYCGVDVHEISASQVKELFPLAKTDDILAGFYVKEDGQANPVDITMARQRCSSEASPSSSRCPSRGPAKAGRGQRRSSTAISKQFRRELRGM
jgi:glycine/D-amino acid oxidase-like deaminating enzyme